MKKKTDKTRAQQTDETGTDEAHEEVVDERGAAPETSENARDRLADQLQRAMADLQNIRKRHLKEMEDARRRAIEGLASELLPVLDNFRLALAAHEQRDEGDRDDDHAVVEGVRMVRSLLQGVLERHGLSEIPALGVAFDPNVHEAVGMDDQADVEAGQVSRVMQNGYKLGDRVIRPAKVIVAGQSQSGGTAEERESEHPPKDEGE